MQWLSSKLRSQNLKTTDIQRALRRPVSKNRYHITLDKGLNVVIQGVTGCSEALCIAVSINSKQQVVSYLNQADTAMTSRSE